jgi:DNA-binding CsgD family transcriptional regulator
MTARRETPTLEEIETIRAVAEHGTVPKAAKALWVSPHTVDTRLDRMREMTGLRHATQLVWWAARMGYLDNQCSDLFGPGESPDPAWSVPSSADNLYATR